MTKYVINKNDTLHVISTNGFKPKGTIGKLPEGINKEDYPYLTTTPVMEDDIQIGVEISVDQDAKDADAASRQTNKDDNAMKILRNKRNLLLADTDFTQLADAPLTEQQKNDYAAYRQALRDLPDNVVDVHNPVYPTKPGS